MADRPSPNARKRLPVKPSLEYLQKQAKRHTKQQPGLTLAKAQHEMAKAYGCRDWAELTRIVATMNRQASSSRPEALSEAANAGLDRETLDAFGQALLGDGGDIDRVRRMLDRDPRLANCNPWSPGWVGSAVEAVAGMCVWHRPAQYAIARLLLERGANCSLQTAARAGLLDEVKRQADERGWVFEEVDAQGRSPMYRAACVYGKFHEAEAVADYLIEQGARPDLYVACTLGLLDCVRGLLADDPSLAKVSDPDGMTALHWAVRNRRHPEQAVEIVRQLLEAGAELQATNPTEDGMRPLHHAAEWPASPEVVDLLLARGADINALAAASRWAPLDYAIDRGREQVAEQLRAHGGRRREELGIE
ncbi:MAG: ankyrin repeat domain-containing protein [Planctomycetota bacterium]